MPKIKQFLKNSINRDLIIDSNWCKCLIRIIFPKKSINLFWLMFKNSEVTQYFGHSIRLLKITSIMYLIIAESIANNNSLKMAQQIGNALLIGSVDVDIATGKSTDEISRLVEMLCINL